MSSHATKSEDLNVSSARKVMSPRFPMGVPTIYKTDTDKIYRQTRVRARRLPQDVCWLAGHGG